MAAKYPSITDFREDVQKCMRCGFCVALCPVEEYMGFESNSPRGRMQTIKALIDGEVKVNDYMMNRIYNCTLCGYCLWRCPPGVKTVDVIKAARAYFVKNKCYPEVVDTLDKFVRENYHIYDLPKEARTEWIDYMNVKDVVNIKDKADIVYFVGCVASLSGRAMGIAAATSQILNRLNLNWTILGMDEQCCGTPLLLSGKIEFAKDLAKHNVEAIRKRGAKTVVTSCAGCFRVFTQDYPKLIGDLGFEVYHTSQLLDRMLDQVKAAFKNEIKMTAVYHDPCEIGRLVGLYDPPRRVLKAIPGLNIVELAKTKELTRCCGGGGVLKAVFPDTALKLALKKIDEFQGVGANAAISGCPSCKLNISDAIAERGAPVQMLDITEIVAKAMGFEIA
jgi:heterodisulfide reductase subunit D